MSRSSLDTAISPIAGQAAAQGSSRSRTALVASEQWLGSNGYAAFRALRRGGWTAHLVPEREFIPLRWKSRAMRAAGRLLRSAGVTEFNAELLRQAEQQRPDFFLAFKGAFVTAESLRRMKALGIRTYCFFPDVSFHVHGKYLPEALPVYDWIFIAKSFGVRDLASSLGVRNASLLLHGFDPEVHRPLSLTDQERQAYGCDVSFIGTWSPKKEAILASLVNRRPSIALRVWGEQWRRENLHPALSRSTGGREVTGDEYAKAIIASRINLGLLSEQRPGASSGDQITSRTFHIPACGSFMLHERTSELLEQFDEGVTVACFEGADELAERVDEYLSDESRRTDIARRGHDLVWSRDSWDHRVAAIVEHHMRVAPPTRQIGVS
ncbi:MAG TPA: glycosyltransferase [Gemmatimonadaceae bacterium]|nr:glycosyltransferase [Gemmatimonadaceae bacterium]